MKKSVKILIGVIVGAVVLFALIGGILFATLFSALNKTKNADYYDMGGDQISSVKAVLGARDINEVSTSKENGVLTKTYDYRSSTSAEDVEQYISYITEKEGFTFTNLNGGRQVYAKESADEGKLLVIDITDSGYGFTLTIQKGEGTLNLTDESSVDL